MHLFGWDYSRDRRAEGIGLIRFARQIDELRSGASVSVLVDNGDFLQGTLLGDWHVNAWRRDPETPHPMILAMEELGYDAVTLGNHEFDYGLEYLDATCASARFPIVSANLLGPEDAAPPLPSVLPWTLIERSIARDDVEPIPLRIGIFGVAPPQTMDWNRRALAGRARITGVVEAASRAVAELRQAGSDLVVALSHSGIAPRDDPSRDENTSLLLADIPGIDAIVAGHTHKVFPGPDHNGIPGIDPLAGKLGETAAVMPGRWGSHLGQIDLTLRHCDRLGWTVVSPPSVRLHNASRQRRRDPDSHWPSKQLVALHENARTWGRFEIGRSNAALQSYFAPVESGAACELMARAQLWAATQDLDPALSELPILSAVSPFRSGGRAGPKGYVDIPPGRVTRASAAMLFPFPNELRVLKVDGAGIRRWLDHAAARFSQISAGDKDRPLVEEDWLAHNFDIVFGLDYQIDLSVPGRPCGQSGPSRISKVEWRGCPVADGTPFLLVTNEYRANGGGGFSGCVQAATVAEPRLTAQAALEGFLTAHGPYRPDHMKSVFDFAPIAGASAVFATGPEAAKHLPDTGRRDLERLDRGADGFDRYRIRFD